ncbi:uncharacterized protein LOC130621599 [Hydractinia symbiolongicarpus]|uniref:uncharacterized protein LOC130621599 n=1 Tax=Hydractinia symbiolongicarpus TaxID=13093 RepID=UPI00254BB66B|nr:uncharacterized protein LOC130621599 [Hydractinia symbiolongicarpus]
MQEALTTVVAEKDEKIHVNLNDTLDQSTTSDSRSMSSFVESWAQVSYGIGASLNEHTENTVYSLLNIPSSDRRSNSILMSINLQSMIMGTTMLSVPYCVRLAGIWAIVMVVVIGFVTNFTASIISDCQYQLSLSNPGLYKRVYATFIDMSKACWNKAGTHIMVLLTYLSLARNIVVIILLSDVTSEILAVIGITTYNKQILSVIWTLLTIPLLLIRKISILAWISFIGLILYLSALFSMLILSCFSCSKWNFSQIPWRVDITKIGIAIGIIINSYAVHLNLPNLEGSLSEPGVYMKTTTVTFLINIFTKIAFALCCYLTYTDTTQPEITSNIDGWFPMPLLLRIAIMFFSYFTIPLQNFVVFEMIDQTLLPHFPIFDNNIYVWTILSRSVFMTMCLFVAILIPHFGIVVSLIGSVRGSIVALVLPACIYIKIQTHEKTYCKKILCYLVVLFGSLAGGVGLYSSIAALL